MLYNFDGFSGENIDFYFNELSKNIKKQLGRNINIDIIVVGGASIVMNYTFRNSTTDIDYYNSSGIAIKDMINSVGDKYGLPNGWLNNDFVRTSSFSYKINSYSKFYKRFNQVLTVRTIKDEYLIAMKLASFRLYKNDLSDIVGIVLSMKEKNVDVSFKTIDKAVYEIYGGWDAIKEDAKSFVIKVFNTDNLKEYLVYLKENEKENKELLKGFESDYSGVLKSDNIDDILYSLKEKSDNKGFHQEISSYNRSSIKSLIEDLKKDETGSASDDEFGTDINVPFSGIEQ